MRTFNLCPLFREQKVPRNEAVMRVRFGAHLHDGQLLPSSSEVSQSLDDALVFLYQTFVSFQLPWRRDFVDARAKLPQGCICLFVVFQPGEEEVPPCNCPRE
jgi:hypothetical protein